MNKYFSWIEIGNILKLQFSFQCKVSSNPNSHLNKGCLLKNHFSTIFNTTFVFFTGGVNIIVVFWKLPDRSDERYRSPCSTQVSYVDDILMAQTNTFLNVISVENTIKYEDMLQMNWNMEFS